MEELLKMGIELNQMDCPDCKKLMYHLFDFQTDNNQWKRFRCMNPLCVVDELTLSLTRKSTQIQHPGDLEKAA
jgi:hypothetical protein